MAGRLGILSFARREAYAAPSPAHAYVAASLTVLGWLYLAWGFTYLVVTAWHLMQLQSMPTVGTFGRGIQALAAGASLMVALLAIGWTAALAYWCSYARFHWMRGHTTGSSHAWGLAVVVALFEGGHLAQAAARGATGLGWSQALLLLDVARIAAALVLLCAWALARPRPDGAPPAAGA